MEDKLQKEIIKAELKANIKQPAITRKVKRTKQKKVSSCSSCG